MKREMLLGVLTALIVAVLAVAGAGCVRKIYVPVSQVRTDSLYDVRQHADTLLARDSIYVGLRGDTVIREVYRWRLKSRVRVDTVYRTRVDSIPVVVTPPAENRKQQSDSPWERFKLILNIAMWTTRVLLLLMVLFFAFRFVRNLLNR